MGVPVPVLEQVVSDDKSSEFNTPQSMSSRVLPMQSYFLWNKPLATYLLSRLKSLFPRLVAALLWNMEEG